MIELQPNLVLPFRAIFTKAPKFYSKILLNIKEKISPIEGHALSKLAAIYSLLRQPLPNSLCPVLLLVCPPKHNLTAVFCFSVQIGDRLKRMNQAGKLFLLQTVEQGSLVGMVMFDSAAQVQSELVQINGGAERDALIGKLPTAASGGTSICSGLRSAFTVRQVPLLKLVHVYNLWLRNLPFPVFLYMSSIWLN